eukprot:gnl/MRDRNA2_/MRDRNA2_81123_c0_seq1.p1 gnl/MRDRNA2_/MRDRNA2_81123_c0~~gnl/MRDRNA2_/MRDRNA2_81123_c0_seq1.p1  ORF type:complete len:167 (-),score=2.18 gnl/MRDRNA2_/MRDRNA2_81123_c0_seq1:122-589(-)
MLATTRYTTKKVKVNSRSYNLRLYHSERNICCKARIGGVDVPQNKLIKISLQYIYGVGHSSAERILTNTNIENKRTFELNEEELQKLRDEVDNFCYEGDLRRINALSIKRLKEIGSYRGRRHISGLPLNGQRSKTNARTRKGKAKTVAGKKIARK